MGGLIHTPPLAVPAEQQDPLQNYAKMLSIRQLGTQQEIQKQTMQANDLKIQQEQIQLTQAHRDQQDHEATNKAWLDSGGDPQKFQELLPQYGASYQASQQAKMGQAAMVEKLAQSDEATFKAHKEANGLIGQNLQEIHDAAPEDQAPLYALKYNAMKRDPALSKYLPPSITPTFPGPDALKSGMIGVGMNDALMKEADEKRKAALAGPELQTKQAEATIKGAEATAVQQGGVAPGIPIETQEANAWLKAHPDKTLVDYQKYAKTLVPAFNFNLQAAGVGAGQGGGTPATNANGQPATYSDQIKSFGPKGGVVKAIIEGRQDPPASFAQKSPYWQDVMQKVYAVDPEFNQQRAQLRKDYTVGKHSTEINAINTAMGHVGVMGDAIDALNNNDVKGLNKLANAVGVQIGRDNVTTFNTIVHRVGPELSKAYIGSGGSAGERGADEKDFDPSLGPQQLKSNVGITAQLLRSKIGSLENQWDQNKAPSMPSFQQQFISKEANKQLNKWSPQGGGASGTSGRGGITVTAPNGKPYTFKDQASADAFKKAAGIQ